MPLAAVDRTAPLPLPPLLERACAQVREAALEAARQTVDSLGLAALSAHEVNRRDALRAAQFELGRKTAVFAQAFNEALDVDVARQFGLLQPAPLRPVTPEGLIEDWAAMSLVDDQAMNQHLALERLTQVLSHRCDWELREFSSYIAALMGQDRADPAANPLRPEVAARAVMQAVDAVSGRPEVRAALAEEIGRSLSGRLRDAYQSLVNEWRARGLRPAGLVVRQNNSRSTRPGDLAPDAPESQPLPDLQAPARPPPAPTPGAPTAAWRAPQGHGHAHPTAANAGQSHTAPGTLDGAEASATGPASFGGVDPSVMQLLRRLAGDAPARSGQPTAAGEFRHTADPRWSTSGRPPPINQIATHRDALREAAGGPLDHLVIDLVAGLFDQILSDRRVPSPFARELARLQMPVLRAALGDSRFFASRRHPVRRLVNRIASLAAACGDVAQAPGAALLAEVSACVQDIVDGDFDRPEVYEQQLMRLDRHVADQARGEVQALGDADELLARKERELVAAERFSQLLDEGLAPLPVPEPVREFMRRIWSRAIARVSFKEGADSPLARHLREVGRDLVMSVQPKGAPPLREAFLRGLPRLMKALNLGLDHARCPEADRRAFFGQLLPAHAQALKSAELSVLDHNLLARQVEAVFDLPIPGPLTLARTASEDLQTLSAQVQLSPGEAAAIGWVHDGSLDLDLSEPLAPASAAESTVVLPPGQAEPAQASAAPRSSAAAEPPGDAPVTQVDLVLDGLPEPEAPEPTRGAGLIEHLHIGFGYLMQLQGRWEEVKLAHVTPGRGFFVFTHGQGERQTVSMTHRMLLRLCQANRVRMLEPALLLDRATARVRRQLASLLPATP